MPNQVMQKTRVGARRLSGVSSLTQPLPQLRLDVRRLDMARCHICGWELDEAPWGETGTDPTWLICDCCGCEFGYEDATEMSALAFRQRWLKAGAKWFQAKNQPKSWNLAEHEENGVILD